MVFEFSSQVAKVEETTQQVAAWLVKCAAPEGGLKATASDLAEFLWLDEEKVTALMVPLSAYFRGKLSLDRTAASIGRMAAAN